MPYINPNDLGITSPFKAEFASYLIKESVQKDVETIKVWQASHSNDAKNKRIPENLVGDDYEATAPNSNEVVKIGIIGGGIAGLYTALILQELKIDFDILEASDRVGGRLRTHYFTPRPEPPEISHDYYDVGAMRFPNTPIMVRYRPVSHGVSK